MSFVLFPKTANFSPKILDAFVYFIKSTLTTLSCISMSPGKSFSTQVRMASMIFGQFATSHSYESNTGLNSNRPNVVGHQAFLLSLCQLFLKQACRYSHCFLIYLLSHLHILQPSNQKTIDGLRLHPQDVAPSLMEQTLVRPQLHHFKNSNLAPLQSPLCLSQLQTICKCHTGWKEK